MSRHGTGTVLAILAMLFGVGICALAGGTNGAIPALLVLLGGLLVIRLMTWRATP